VERQNRQPLSSQYTVHVVSSLYVSGRGTFRNTVLNLTQFYALDNFDNGYNFIILELGYAETHLSGNRNFCSHVLSLPGTFVPWNSQELSFPGTFAERK